MAVILIETGHVAEGLKKLEMIKNMDPTGPVGKQADERIDQIRKDMFKGIPKEAAK
jgi:hypothetical protein